MTANRFAVPPELVTPSSNWRRVCEYKDQGSFSVDYYGQVVYERENQYGKILVLWNPTFGYMLFHDGEIQISQRDFYDFHWTMAEAAHMATAERILIVGDGDGGFTKLPCADKIVQIERDADMREAGARFFGADWGKLAKLHATSWEEFCLSSGGFDHPGSFDSIMFAVTDDFMRENVSNNVLHAVNLLSDHGTILIPVGCELEDFTAAASLAAERVFAPMFHEWRIEKSYFASYFSNYCYFVGSRPRRD